MEHKKILLPYNFTTTDEKALNYVAQRYKDDVDAELVIFHAYTPIPKLEVSDKTVMGRLSGDMAYLRQKKYELETEIKNVRDRLVNMGFNKEKVRYIFKPQEKDVAQEIIELVKKEDCSILILNRNPGGMIKYFTASISKKVTKALPDINMIIVV